MFQTWIALEHLNTVWQSVHNCETVKAGILPRNQEIENKHLLNDEINILGYYVLAEIQTSA